MPHSRDLILANLLRFRHCPISRTGTLLKRRGKSSCQIYRLRFQRRAIEDSKAKNKCHLTVVIQEHADVTGVGFQHTVVLRASRGRAPPAEAAPKRAGARFIVSWRIQRREDV